MYSDKYVYNTHIDTDTHSLSLYNIPVRQKIVLKIKIVYHTPTPQLHATHRTLQWHRRSMYHVNGTHMEKHFELKRENRNNNNNNDNDGKDNDYNDM